MLLLKGRIKFIFLFYAVEIYLRINRNNNVQECGGKINASIGSGKLDKAFSTMNIKQTCNKMMMGSHKTVSLKGPIPFTDGIASSWRTFIFHFNFHAFIYYLNRVLNCAAESNATKKQQQKQSNNKRQLNVYIKITYQKQI